MLQNLIWQETTIKLAAIKNKMRHLAERTLLEKIWNISIQDRHVHDEYTTWKRPPEIWVAVNCDGSINDEGEASWAAGVRDSEGKPLAIIHGKSKFKEINRVELEAIYEGIKLTIERGYTRIKVQLDSMNAINYVNGRQVPWDVKGVTRSTKEMTQSLHG